MVQVEALLGLLRPFLGPQQRLALLLWQQQAVERGWARWL
jgi:hypothetical protein